MYINNEGDYNRGCTSDNDEGFQKCLEAGEKCSTCNHENGCNSRALIDRPTQYCVQCPETDPACAWGFPIGYGEICKAHLPIYKTQGCFVFEFEDGGIRRGCTYDEREFCEEHKCEMCFTQECNRQTKNVQQCIQCISSESEGEDRDRCADRPEELEGAICRPDPTLEKQGCYSYTDCELLSG